MRQPSKQLESLSFLLNTRKLGYRFLRETGAGREEKHAFRHCPELAWRAITIANSCAFGGAIPHIE